MKALGVGPVSMATDARQDCLEAAQGDVDERQPSQPWCVGTAQLTSEADAASKPVPEGNVWHQGLASVAPGSC